MRCEVCGWADGDPREFRRCEACGRVVCNYSCSAIHVEVKPRREPDGTLSLEAVKTHLLCADCSRKRRVEEWI
jgi:hypothetical protein